MRPSTPAFSEADPDVPHPPPVDSPLFTPRPRYRPLRQVIGAMDLDILAELDRFRHWHQDQSEKSPETEVQPLLQGTRSQWSHLQPQEVVEDLEMEPEPQSGSGFTSLLVLLLWLLSCSGIGIGLWWLISPGEPERLWASFAPPTPAPLPPLPDLDALPIIPLSPATSAPGADPSRRPNPTTPAQITAAATATPTVSLDLDGVEVQQIAQPSWLDLLQQEQSQFGGVPTPSSSREQAVLTPASPPRSDPAPLSRPPSEPEPIPTPVAAAPTPVASDPLANPQGEGTYLVLMSYQGEEALARARQVSTGAFLKTIDGQQYIQLAAFRQLEHARYMADDLRQQGYSVQVEGE